MHIYMTEKQIEAFAAAGPLGHSRTSPKLRNFEGSLLCGYKQSPVLLSTVNSVVKNTCAVLKQLFLQAMLLCISFFLQSTAHCDDTQ